MDDIAGIDRDTYLERCRDVVRACCCDVSSRLPSGRAEVPKHRCSRPISNAPSNNTTTTFFSLPPLMRIDIHRRLHLVITTNEWPNFAPSFVRLSRTPSTTQRWLGSNELFASLHRSLEVHKTLRSILYRKELFVNISRLRLTVRYEKQLLRIRGFVYSPSDTSLTFRTVISSHRVSGKLV